MTVRGFACTALLTAALGSPSAARHAIVSAPMEAANFPHDERAIAHVLNRVAFGGRSRDIERVQRIGLSDYIGQQLHPERISDSAMSARLADLTTIGLTSAEIAERFERPVLELRRQAKQQAQESGDQESRTRPPERMALQQQANNVLIELSEQKLLRAIYSDRQLEEVLTDFWFNHFNVDARKGRDRFLLTEYERETIRPRVLGKFRDLLGADAKSPAMLFYLDNWMSTDPNGLHGVRNGNARLARPGLGRGRFPIARPPVPLLGRLRTPPNAPKGLNENYGRELMELHTLGVDGGYTQKDVTEVARAFTGWTLDKPGRGGTGFRYEERMHDEGEKIVLGHHIKAGGGMNDGEQVLDILASHPSTARFISTKLARRFVSDTPPPALVDRMASRFLDTHGDLREVMRTLLFSPEFLAPDAYDAKVKTPFEFVVSGVRSLGGEISDPRPLVRAMQQLGMPLYQCQPPTGYKDTSDAWMNTGALVNRMNVAQALGQYALSGPAVKDEPFAATRDRFVQATLGSDVSETTRATIAKATALPEVVALTLGSPEFQRR